MSWFKQAMRRRVPPVVWSGWALLRRMSERSLTPQGWISIQRLRRFHNAHRGERCFIIGNGPSLQQTNLSLLRREYTFGLNRGYLLFAHLGFTTTYYVATNPYVIEQCAAELNALTIPKFLGWVGSNHIAFDPYTILIHTWEVPLFSTDPSHRMLWGGGTVTYEALQLAYYMGFSQVILVGVDHHFVRTGPPGELVVAEEHEDPDHFSPDYFGRGFRWQLPDLELSRKAYLLARDAFAQDGREILDATIGGRLTVFPRVAYASLFERQAR